jgi:hypothetical protein
MRKPGAHKQYTEARTTRPVPIPAPVLAWLRDHPNSWSGWPTFNALTAEEARDRLARLEAAGCPGACLRSLKVVHQAVARLRVERRQRYARQAYRTSWEFWGRGD